MAFQIVPCVYCKYGKNQVSKCECETFTTAIEVAHSYPDHAFWVFGFALSSFHDFAPLAEFCILDNSS